MCPTRAFFNPQMLFSNKKLQKFLILTLRADEVSISTALLTRQTLVKSILRKISLDHSIELQKNWRIRYNWYERYLISWHTRHSRAPNASNCTDMDLIWSIWYWFYQTSFCQPLSWVGFVSFLTLPRYDLDKQLQVHMPKYYSQTPSSSKTGLTNQ